ncbi:MAG TPA: methylated-DNA--[protein]-cysteine S-methyltransferase [Gemmatimonadaceae bacterium]|nr:methylated-DNA--[protein]-cysteine S-methyltransferase [Gemmatimonadaceae bacterium]
MTVLASPTVIYDVVPTPIDRLVVASDGSSIVGVWMANAEPDDRRWVDRCGTDSLIDEARRQLVAYFAGRLRTFDLPLAPNGTDFQRRVWSALREIPFGTTISYAELARRVSNSAAVRAVGAANGRNPIPIIVPCHRVIGSDGSLTGFGGGLHRKQWLLRHEGGQIEF